MRCLNLQDYQAKTHNYRKGLTYLNTSSTNQTEHYIDKKKKSKVLKQKITGDHPTKKRKEEWRIIEPNGNKYLSIIILNVNGLNAPIKRQSG